MYNLFVLISIIIARIQRKFKFNNKNLHIIRVTQAVDKDQSGHITQEEYNKFIECIGTSKKVVLHFYIFRRNFVVQKNIPSIF